MGDRNDRAETDSRQCTVGKCIKCEEEIAVEKKKIKIPQLKELKQQGKRFTMVTAYDYLFASIAAKLP